MPSEPEVGHVALEARDDRLLVAITAIGPARPGVLLQAVVGVQPQPARQVRVVRRDHAASPVATVFVE